MKQAPTTVTSRLFRSIVRFWFVVTFLSQLVFAYYVLMVYWRSIAARNWEHWNTVNSHFFVRSDRTGNLVFALHVFFAAIVTLLGPLQLVPQIRSRAPRIHRWCGRVYISTAILMGLSGLYLTWVRSAIGGLQMSIAITFNALIILTTAFFAIRYARARNFKLHQQWAVHLFVAMSGVWMFRVFFMLWMVIHQAPVGFDPDTFTGPFLTALAIGVYIFPQAIVAWYFSARQTYIRWITWGFTLFLLLTTLGIFVGTIGATLGMWLPRI
ncbi:DUF2306 domain-containing protein [Paraflavitalea pollutisoli]|uniref:DUF2306 domain-containing protein n=1 Tax=Paraflavitalea pollutisoli TaxID=3034143 RepID=UPI0023EDD057|nr:DUF2306 domain-containing protein [Paraflavitalea sp. H1-2-19X]